jgi:hypothetical protein
MAMAVFAVFFNFLTLQRKVICKKGVNYENQIDFASYLSAAHGFKLENQNVAASGAFGAQHPDSEAPQSQHKR